MALTRQIRHSDTLYKVIFNMYIQKPSVWNSDGFCSSIPGFLIFVKHFFILVWMPQNEMPDTKLLRHLHPQTDPRQVKLFYFIQIPDQSEIPDYVVWLQNGLDFLWKLNTKPEFKCSDKSRDF